MNPLLNRLFEDRSKSKSKRFSLQKQDHNRSVDKVLVPKMPTRVRLDSLPEPFVDKKKSNAQRVYVGKLPSISFNTQQLKEKCFSRPNFRNRKLSSSIRDMQGNFFSTQFGQNPMVTEYQVEQSMIKQHTKTKFTQISQKEEINTQQQNEQQLFQYLKVIQNNQELNQEFCYMNRKEIPYSYYIVDYQDRNKHEYLTVSLRGITCYKQEKQSEFYTIKKFKKQIQQFKGVKRIFFFKNYIKMKVMMHWKEKMIRKKFNLKCKYIITHLFSQNLIIQEYLHFMHSLGQNYSGGNFFNFNITLTRTLKQFQQITDHGCKELLKSIKKFDNILQKQLSSVIQSLIHKFRAQERVTIGSADKRHQNEAYLPFDSKRRSMKYTQMAKLKQFQGNMYRLIKYTDMFRFNTKVSLIRKCYQNSIQELKNLKKAFQNKETIRFTNWIYVIIDIQEKEDTSILHIQPNLAQISAAVIHLKDYILKEIFREHRLFIEKKDEMFCENINFQYEQRPSKFQLKYFIIKNPQFQLLDGLFTLSLKDITDQIQSLLQKYDKILMSIYHRNVMNTSIQEYLDNIAILSYLSSYREEYSIINNYQDAVEYALAVLKITALKQKTRKSADNKFKIISNSIPNEVIKRCEQLQIQIRNFHTKFKETPYTVQQYITFHFNYQQQKHKISYLEAKLQKILQFQEIVYKYGIRIGQTAKSNITQCQTLFKQMAKRAEEVQSNEENERKKFENMVDQMIPSIQDKADELLKQIRSETIINHSNSDIKRALQRLSDVNESFEKIKARKEQLFNYQNQMKLGHKQMQMFDKLEPSVNYMHQIWQSRSYFFKVEDFIKVTGYGHVNELSLEPLLSFINSYQNYSMILECYELLQDFKQQTAHILKIIKLSQVVSADTLQLEHLNDLKKILKSPKNLINIDHMFSKEGKSNITCLQIFTDTNASQIWDQISQIVFMSAQQSIVKNQLLQIQQYWKKTKIKLVSEDIAQNQILIQHLDLNEELQEKIGYYFVMLKNIEGSAHIIGLGKDRVSINSRLCTYLRQFLWKWAQVQRQWIKLLPLMTNCPAVKHQSNVFFDFTSVDHNLRKLIRLVADMSSLRKICDDYKQNRYMNILKDCQQQLKHINITFNQFLQNKRSTYGRFYFLSDYELINILQHVKDAKTANKYISLCFNCNKLQLDNVLLAGFKHKNEIFKLRKAILKGETDEIFKSIQQNMKNSMKLNIKTLIPKLKISPNIQKQMQEYPLQVILVCDRIFWTQMSQTYLNTTSYGQYKLLMNNICEKMIQLIRKAGKQHWHKLSLRYVQMISLRQICLQLVRDQINVNDFKWKQQIRMYTTEQQVMVNQFDGKLIYYCQYYPPGQINIATINTTRFLYETFYSCVNNKALVINGSQGQGKRHLIQQSGSYFGAYQKETVCNSRLSHQFIVKLIQGAINAGAWLSFYEFNSLDYSVCAELLHLVNKANSVQYKSQQYLFMFIHHQVEYQQISIYGFNHFAVYEPDKQKICQYLLEVYRFKDSQQMSSKIMKFMKLIKPFLNKVLGSEFQLVKKVINRAGEKRIQSEFHVNQNHLIAEAITIEIIKKQKQNKSQILSKALSSYFDLEYKITEIQDKYNQKMQTLQNMVAQKVKNIIVLGQRCCKSTLIKQVLNSMQRQAIYLFGETTDNYLSSQTMQFLSLIQKDKIIIYDSNWAISEWVDLITSGYLFIDGKRLILENQAIMQFRDISQGSPSFVGKCHILYLGQNVVTKLDKFNQILSKDNSNYRHIADVFHQLFGKNLQNISQTSLFILANVLKNFKQTIPLKNIHRMIVWILSIIQKESIWTRQYGGKHTDFTIYGSQLIAIDTTRYETLPSLAFEKYLITPTKQISFILDVINLFQQFNLNIHIEGPPQSGKSSLFGLLTKKYELKSKISPHQWSQFIKNKYTYIRKQGKNVLLDLQKQGHKIIIDDLDLGTKHNYQYLRVLIQTSSFRDKYFQEYFIQKFKLLTSSRQHQKIGKFWSKVCVLSLKQMNKQSLQTIFEVNFNKQINEYGMNREVQDLIQGNIMKSIMIAHEDLANIYGVNASASLLLGLLRNLLSLPKRQAYISNNQYYLYFKDMFIFKLKEKILNKRIQWKTKSVYQNIFKVVFGEKVEQGQQKILFSDGQFKLNPVKEVKQKVEQLYPSIISFEKLTNSIIYLINQLNCMDNNIILLGKKGTGKKLILDISCKIADIRLEFDLPNAIISAINNQKVVLSDSLQKQQTFYENLQNCQTDKDLQKLINIQMRERFHTRAAGEDLNESKMLEKCKKMIIFALSGSINDYEQFTSRNRQGLNMPACFIQQWPPEALLSIYSANDSFANIHADLYVSVNNTLSNNNIPSFSLKYFQKYLKLYTEIYRKENEAINNKAKLHENINFKFNQSYSMVSAWQARVQILKTEIQATIKKSKKTILINQLYCFALSVLYKQIKGQEEKFAAQTAQLKKLTQDVNKKIVLLQKVLKKIQKIVSSFQRTELGEFKKIYKQNKVIYFGAECLCILLGQQNTEQKTINRILADPNLLMRMKASQILTQRNQRLQIKFNKQFHQMQNQLKQNTNQLAKTLIEWLKSILQYWQTNHELKSEQAKHVKAKQSLQKSSTRHGQLQAKVYDTKRLIEEKTLIINENQNIKSEKQIEYNSISERLINAQKIIPILKHQQQQTKKIIQQLITFRDNLRGNIILAAFTAIFLSLQPLQIKQKLLDLAKIMLRKSIIPFSKNFMADISGQKIDSLPSLNYYLLHSSTLTKLVIDPHRKFLNYLEIKASQEIRQGIIDYTPVLRQFQIGKIYHSITSIKQNKQNLLIIDWQALALEERQAIFLSIAQFKNPQYFQVKNQLQIQINRNIQKLTKMKENLYETICQRQMKIIDDENFIQNGEQLQKLEQQTQNLKKKAQEKINQIEQLTASIDQQVTKIIYIFDILKHFRKVDLELMLNICRQNGNTVQNFIRWSLSNIKSHHRNTFLIAVIIAFKKQRQIDMLRDVINQSPLKMVETKIKKPHNISSKHWDVVVRLSEYSLNFKKLMQNVVKFQIEFEKWCIDPISHILPQQIGVQLQYSELWMLLHYIKPKVTPYLLHKMINQELKYDLAPLRNKHIIQTINTKFPIIVQNKIDYIVKLAKELNDSKYNMVRINKIKGQVEMKKIIWKSMQAKEWLICYDITDKKDLQMMQDICYYVMNYDKQPGFRILIVVDGFISHAETSLQKLIKSSTFITSNSIHLYEQAVSCDSLIQQHPIEYQISKSQSLTNKHIFNLLYKLIAVCFTVLRGKYPQLKHLSFKKLLYPMQFIKFKNIVVEFNVFTIVQYLSRMASHVVTDIAIRREIQQIWEHIVDQSKMTKNVIHGINFDSQRYDKYIEYNDQITGCTQGHYIRLYHQQFGSTLQHLSKIFTLHQSKQEVLALIRTQLGRTPIEISHKQLTNTYNYYYQIEIRNHNQRVAQIKQVLEQINSPSQHSPLLDDKFKLQFDKISYILTNISKSLNTPIGIHNFKNELTNAISMLRKQHQFILYFNPSLPIVFIHPNLVYNLEMLLSTHTIHQLFGNQLNNGDKWLPMLQFTNFANQKELIDCRGLYLSNLESVEFVYNKQMKTIDPSYEIDGKQPCPIVKIFLKEQKPSKQQSKQDTQTLEITIQHRNDRPQLKVEYSVVYREWGLRDPKLIIK